MTGTNVQLLDVIERIAKIARDPIHSEHDNVSVRALRYASALAEIADIAEVSLRRAVRRFKNASGWGMAPDGSFVEWDGRELTMVHPDGARYPCRDWTEGMIVGMARDGYWIEIDAGEVA